MIVCLLLLTISLLVTAQASNDFVINHVITDKIIQAQDDSLYIGQVLLGFSVGRAKFHTLTQVSLPKGTHQGQVAIEDPSGKTISQVRFLDFVAEIDNSLHTLVGNWDVEFKQPGTYSIAIYIDKILRARFNFVVVEKSSD